MVSGDVAFRIMYILAFIGTVPASTIGILLSARDLRKAATSIGQNYTLAALVALAAVLILFIVFLILRNPIPEEATLSLRAGIFSSVLAGIIFWTWLTYTNAYKLPVFAQSELYLLATASFLDFWLAITAILVAMVTAIERT